MAITQTARGLGAVDIVYDAGTSLADLMTIIDTWVTGHGWQRYYTNGTDILVYRCLDQGGNSGDDTHYSYIELNFATVNRLILRQWLSWAGSAGVQAAENSYYVPRNAGGFISSVSNAAQPISVNNGLNLGGSFKLISHAGLLYIKAITPERAGNLASARGTLITRRLRLLASDVLGTPQCVYMHVDAMIPVLGGHFIGTYPYRWSMPKGVDGSSSNVGGLAGSNAAFWMPYTAEVCVGWQYSDVSQAHNALLNTIDFLRNTRRASHVIMTHMTVGGSAVSTFSEVGILHNVVRPAGNLPDDATVSVLADSNGIPAQSGALTDYIIVSGSIGIKM